MGTGLGWNGAGSCTRAGHPCIDVRDQLPRIC
jgi:hypothetical protein